MLELLHKAVINTIKVFRACLKLGDGVENAVKMKMGTHEVRTDAREFLEGREFFQGLLDVLISS
jgi:hypothetical protein